jgi:adenylyl-sulfate kinase
VNPDTLRHHAAAALEMNDIGCASFTLFEPLLVDEYRRNRSTGSFILIDPASNETVGAGMVIDSHPAPRRSDLMQTPARGQAHRSDDDGPVSERIARQTGTVDDVERARIFHQRPATIWFTGLSGSGKSTLAYALERRLVDLGHPCYVLDGDNLRHGLSRDLGFSPEDRRENIRRVAEVARLMNDAGLIVITAFISPYHEDRVMARRTIGASRFVELHLSTELDTCEKRDPKGLYVLARRGDIIGFTGIGAPYEVPESPDFRLDTGNLTVDECTDRLFDVVARRIGDS